MRIKKQKRNIIFSLAGVGAVLAPLGAKSLESQKDTKKNILIFLVDDLGYRDTGFTGSDFYETPTIDSLSRLGLIFNNSYTGGANSAPSRACLISGCYTPRHGVYAVDNTTRGPKEQMRLRAVPNTANLPRRIYTLADAMQAAGYNTAIVGKWHLGDKEPFAPKYRGFMTDLSESPQNGQEFKKNNDPKYMFHESSEVCSIMEESVKAGKPFMVYMAFHAVHEGWQAREEYVDYFKAKTPGQQHHEVVYAAMIKHLDDAVRIVTDKVRELGIDRNTVIIFTSDNGGIPLTSQAPLRGFKGCFYEGGIRVPTFIIYPGGVKGSTDLPIINVDYYPTCVEIAGGKVPPNQPLDGESLLGVVTGKSKELKRDAIFWHFPGYLDRPCPGGRDTVFRQRPTTMIRKGDWKLMLYHEEWILDGGRAKIDTNHSVELFNLREDPSEKYNLANTNKPKRDELLDDLLRWMKDTHAGMAKKFTDANRFTEKELQNKAKETQE